MVQLAAAVALAALCSVGVAVDPPAASVTRDEAIERVVTFFASQPLSVAEKVVASLPVGMEAKAAILTDPEERHVRLVDSMSKVFHSSSRGGFLTKNQVKPFSLPKTADYTLLPCEGVASDRMLEVFRGVAPHVKAVEQDAITTAITASGVTPASLLRVLFEFPDELCHVYSDKFQSTHVDPMSEERVTTRKERFLEAAERNAPGSFYTEGLVDDACLGGDHFGITMDDDYGDGWNNARLVVIDCDSLELIAGPISLYDGYHGVDTFCAPSDEFVVAITSGRYPSEVSWDIILHNQLFSVSYSYQPVLSGGANDVYHTCSFSYSLSLSDIVASFSFDFDSSFDFGSSFSFSFSYSYCPSWPTLTCGDSVFLDAAQSYGYGVKMQLSVPEGYVAELTTCSPETSTVLYMDWVSYWFEDGCPEPDNVEEADFDFSCSYAPTIGDFYFPFSFGYRRHLGELPRYDDVEPRSFIGGIPAGNHGAVAMFDFDLGEFPYECGCAFAEEPIIPGPGPIIPGPVPPPCGCLDLYIGDDEIGEIILPPGLCSCPTAEIRLNCEALPEPTPEPTSEPTREPTSAPTQTPTHDPTPYPTDAPTHTPTHVPTTSMPTHIPTDECGFKPPSPAPTQGPTICTNTMSPTITKVKTRRRQRDLEETIDSWSKETTCD